jgi:hypothetical protein
VSVIDDQPDDRKAPLLELSVGLAFRAAVELRQEGLGLAVAHLEAQQLPAPVVIHPHGDDDSAGADLLGLAQPALEVGGIEVDVDVGVGVGVAATLQRPGQKRLHLGIDVLSGAPHLRLRDAALGAQRRHQGINLVPPARWPAAR